MSEAAERGEGGRQITFSRAGEKLSAREKRRGEERGEASSQCVVQGIEEEEEAVVRAGDDICSTLPSMKEKGKKKEEKRRKFVDHEKTLLLPFRAAIPPPLAVVSLPSS